MHQLFNDNVRKFSTLGLGIVTLIFCFSNYIWDLPIADFRPFKNEVNIREQKSAEENAAAAVQITGYRMKNINTKQVVEFPAAQYSKL